METAKDFLNDEQQSIFASQANAHEYFLSRLTQSVSRIRDDFEQLNQTQIKHIDSQYQQYMITIEDYLRQESNHKNKQQPDHEQWHIEQKTMTDELRRLTNDHHLLAQRIVDMVDSSLFSCTCSCVHRQSSFHFSYVSRKRIYMLYVQIIDKNY
jgi:hypothetical protein